MKISVVIITLNEEDRLAAAINSVTSFADELVVVDSYSQDNTVKIAKDKGAKVYLNKFVNYGEQKNFALSKASFPWILNLDADERVSNELRKSILELKKTDNLSHKAYSCNRKNFYLGRWIKHSAWYPDTKIRFINRDFCEWKGKIHERIVYEGKAVKLKGDLLHYTYRDISDHLARINRYSTIQAKELSLSNSKTKLLFKALFKPFFTFIRFYFLKLGFLDGYPGFLIALFSSWGNALKYLKAFQIIVEKNNNISEI